MTTQFKYSGRNRYGEAVHGVLEARNSSEVATYLEKQGIVPLDIIQSTEGLDLLKKLGNLTIVEERISDEELMNFFHQFSLLCKAGVPISKGLRRLAQVIKNKRLSAAANTIADEVVGGTSLSSAFEHHNDIFSNVVAQLARVGENTGSLENSFAYLSGCLAVSRRNRSKMMETLRYPIFIIVTALTAILLMNIYIIPKFVNMFSGMRLTLPWATQMIVSWSNFMINHKIGILMALLLSFLGWGLAKRDQRFVLWLDEWKLKIPYIGTLLRYIMISQFAWSFNMMLRSGISLVQSLKMSADAVFNRYFSLQLMQIADEVEKGSSFADAVHRSGIFPSTAEQMLEIGDETQRLDELSMMLAKAYDENVERSLSLLSEALEPILLAVVGGVVLIMVLGIYLPMWDMMQLFNK